MNQLCRQFVECLCLTFCKSIVEGDVLPFYVSQFMQSVVQCLQKLWKARRRQIANSWISSELLSVEGQRQENRCAANTP